MVSTDTSRLIADLAVAVLARTEVTQDPHDLLVEELRGALEADVLTLNDINLTARTVRLPVIGPAWALSAAPDPVALAPLLCTHPLVRHYAVTGRPDPLTVTDVMDRQSWRACATSAMLREVLGVGEQIAIPLPAPTGTVRAWVAMRDATPFGQHDRELAVELRHLLMAVDTHQEAVRRALRPAAAECDRPPATAAGLTVRELAILQLLSDGLTANAIGHRLGISPRTVSKHLERVYRKLHVSDRLAAVLCAREQRLVQYDDRP